MFSLEGSDDPLWEPSIDDLVLLQESSMVGQIEPDTFKRQRLQVTPPQLR
jgi:hypothetical protein